MVSGSSEAVLFFPWNEGFPIPPFLAASFAEAVVFLFSPSPSSEGATSSILTNMGSGMVSGRGAGHLINFAFAIHSCSRNDSFKGQVYDK